MMSNIDDIYSLIKGNFAAKLPFVVYRKPQENFVQMFCQNNDKIEWLNDFQMSGFIFSPFDSEKKSIIFRTDNCTSYKAQLDVNYKGKESLDDMVLSFDSDQTEANFHKNLVDKTIAEIKSKNFQKIVISRKEKIDRNEVDLVKVFKNILNKYPNAFAYMWFHPKIGLWLGATPETLLKVKGKTIRTMSLAATQKFNGQEEVKWSEKEILEQKLVTDYITKELDFLDLEIGETKSVKAGNLLHLCTKIEGKLNSVNELGKVISKIHPTPAVCGIPLKESRDFILSNEGYDREFYTGYLGELNFNDAETNVYVNLRCMKIEEKTINIYVGGGITIQSNAEKEWEETVVKSRVMKSVL